MPTTYGDLDEKGKHSIVVRVRDCSPATVAKRAFELTVEDQEGTRFPVIVWEKSEEGRTYDWKEGHWYRLGGVSAKNWPSGTVVHGASDLTIEHLGTRQGTAHADILYLTDSHLGKHRHGYGQMSWPVSPADGFRAAIDTAIEENVDAVVHGGDIFHNPGSGIGEEEKAFCREQLIRLAESGIPFYFIYGNHERDAGRRVMDRLVADSLAVHLGPHYESIGGAFALYGIDNHSTWSQSLLNLQPAPEELTPVLFVHQSVAPFTGKKNPDCQLRDIYTGADVSLDVIAVGHTHTRVEKSIHEMQGLSGGATAQVGDSPEALSPSVELISTPGPSVTRRLL